MRPTPSIPDFIKQFRHPLYVNVYERLPKEPRLFGTETLFGDWDAEVFLLAQDCGLVADLDERILAGHPTPHGHGPGLPTNVKLSVLAQQIPQAKLYGSALASLWRSAGSKRRKPPDWGELLPTFVVPVLRWVVGETKFSAIACLGEYAWEAVAVTGGQPSAARQWRIYRDSGRHLDVQISGRTVRAFAMYHPANPRGYDLLGKNWPDMARFLDNGPRRMTPSMLA